MMTTITRRRRNRKARLPAAIAALVLASLAFANGGCFLSPSEVEPYYGQMHVPEAQEFRWSDGGLPQTFDPALAETPPDTDAVRALFEGLTENDPVTLLPAPAVAAQWESSPDARQWTFHLRRDAHWSNGDPVTAQDFVRSWRRVVELGDRAPEVRLLQNIAGVRLPADKPADKPTDKNEPAVATAGQTPAPSLSPSAPKVYSAPKEGLKGAERQPGPTALSELPTRQPASEAQTAQTLVPPPGANAQMAIGIEALDPYTLRVELQEPDRDFPALVAHPIFRPVHMAGPAPLDQSPAKLITNGPFGLQSLDQNAVVLERASRYWDADAVKLDHLRFLPARDAESALAAYHAGDVDAVTNAAFEPLALKLLEPYKDFRHGAFGAITYYVINAARLPFNDHRVREALALAIDRDRISEGTMSGATQPANRFLPEQMLSDENRSNTDRIGYDVKRAQRLIAAAGFPRGIGFPRIRLLVNRNDQQKLLAQAVAEMWHDALGIETEIVLKSWDDYETALRAGDFDIARRGLVMQTTDELCIIEAMFNLELGTPAAPVGSLQSLTATPEPSKERSPATNPQTASSPGSTTAQTGSPLPPPIRPPRTEDQAMSDLSAIPIYFASTNALLKPYVKGFDSNVLGTPALKRVQIDTGWQGPPQKSTIWWR
jgi:oligopeptide transport system substrate-binding protein